MKYSVWRFLLFLSVLPFVSSLTALADVALTDGLPPSTVVYEMGESVHVNGVPLKVVAISVSKPIQEVGTFFYKHWLDQGWTTELRRHGESIIVSGSNRQYLKTVSLTKSGESKTEGSISLSNLPTRLAKGIGADYAVGEHLPKPLNTLVLNEVKVRDAKGESIMTTMSNFFDEEQNINFFRLSMSDRGWKERKFSRPGNGKNGILIYAKGRQETTFTIVRQGNQVFVTANALSP